MVSVIIPNYNHELYLKQRIDSVLNQLYQDFEVIILDDCSIDKSKEIIEKYRSCRKVSHIVYNEVNSGSPFKQWEKGIELAKGEYIWIAESDDYCELTLLSELVKRIEQHEDLVIAYSKSYQVDESGEIMGDLSFHTDPLDLYHWRNDFINDGKEEILKYLLYRNTIPNASAVLFKKAAYLAVNKSFINMKLCGDWMLWVQILKFGKVSYCSKPLNSFRAHGATTRVLDNIRKLRLRLGEEYQIALDIKKSYDVDRNTFINKRLDDIAKQYEGFHSRSELLRFLLASIPFKRESPLYHLLTLKIRRFLGVLG